jgi:hypothetical protein
MAEVLSKLGVPDFKRGCETERWLMAKWTGNSACIAGQFWPVGIAILLPPEFALPPNG